MPAFAPVDCPADAVELGVLVSEVRAVDVAPLEVSDEGIAVVVDADASGNSQPLT
jgi:hypothetical protein